MGLGTEEASRSSSPFGDINIGTTFSITDGQALEDLAATADDILPDEMPLEGLSIPQEVFDNFLEASSFQKIIKNFLRNRQSLEGHFVRQNIICCSCQIFQSLAIRDTKRGANVDITKRRRRTAGFFSTKPTTFYFIV